MQLEILGENVHKTKQKVFTLTVVYRSVVSGAAVAGAASFLSSAEFTVNHRKKKQKTQAAQSDLVIKMSFSSSRSHSEAESRS